MDVSGVIWRNLNQGSLFWVFLFLALHDLGPWHSANLREPLVSLWHMIELWRNRNRQSPLMPGHLGQTLVSDMTFYCRPDVVGSLDSRASRSNCLFCFYGSAPIVIRPKRYLSLQKFKMPEFKNTASLNGL